MENTKKTGTTTVGIMCEDGVVIGADTRATAGRAIVQKDALKVHKISEHIAITFAGSVSDLQLLQKLITAEIALKEIRTKRKITVCEAANLLGNMVYSNIRSYSMIPGITHFVMGGWDAKGYHLFDIFPDGTVSEMKDYVVSGSGGDHAVGVLEDQFNENLSVDQAVELVERAINASMQRDSASGNGIKVLAITEKGVEERINKRVSYALQNN